MKILFLVFSTFILSGISLAQVHHHHHVGSPIIPSKLKSGGQYFEFNSSGLVDYLEYLETSDPKLASAIGGDIKDLRSTDLLASTIKWTSLIGGFVGVSVLLVSDTSDFNSTITTLSVISGLSLAGFYTGWFLQPSRKDYLKVINKHNRLKPDKPLDIDLGYSLPNKNSRLGTLSLSLRF